MPQKISIEEIKEAYTKLKSYIYYDTSELFQRRKLAEFETGLLTEEFNLQALLGINEKVDEKLEKIADLINSHNEKKTFSGYLSQIDFVYLPKKFIKKIEENNFITNKRIRESYELEKITVFADIPIELHLVTILWIMKYGYFLDLELDKSCIGNRLLLNKSKTNIIKGSGLFKPYFKQYQKWRDKSVEEAERKLKTGSSIAFINLDLKDYFYSAQLNFEKIEKEISKHSSNHENCNVHRIFKEFHIAYTEKLREKNYPPNPLDPIKEGHVILPIGIASSYVLANYYLSDFDYRLKKHVPQIYYGRYVDDILIVIENPNFDHLEDDDCKDLKFNINNFIEFDLKEPNAISKSERFILETLCPLVKLIELPKQKDHDNQLNNNERAFKITCLDGAYFQGEKTLLYYFDCNESTAVIDKLKQEIQERTSEFRDFPEDSSDDMSFDEQAYHLIYDGTEGKIRTLKDYKENRYGLSVFLANRIFSSLRKTQITNKNETTKILKLFKGLNNLEYHKLWEKIFTYFVINEDGDGFVEFYKHTLLQIEKLNIDPLKYISNSGITYGELATSLLFYFDISVEISLALNPKFLKGKDSWLKELEIFLSTYKRNSKHPASIFFTTTDSFYINRFRICNLIRHHYVFYPLLNFTKSVYSRELNLVDKHLPLFEKQTKDFEFNDEQIKLSPRSVKFWECCVSKFTFDLLENSNKHIIDCNEIYKFTDQFSTENEQNILTRAFDLFKNINKSHFPTDQLNESDYFKIRNNEFDRVHINELMIPSNEYLNKKLLIAIANTPVDIKNIEESIKGRPILDNKRYQAFANLLNQSRKERVDIFIMPEFSVPYEFVPALAKFAEKNQMAIIAGLEHWNVNDVCYNFIVTIIPVRVNGINDAIVLYRLKNHYAHVEELIIRGYGYQIPKPRPYRYDLINWKNVYFTSFYCFELADTFHRSLFRSKIDLLVASEWNKDIPYFSNIVESLSRDLHCFIAQVNTSQYGDSRLTQPTESSRKDLMRLKGGENDIILVESLDISKLRNFQLKNYERTKSDGDNAYKPLPPDWNREYVWKRINNEFIFWGLTSR